MKHQIVDCLRGGQGGQGEGVLETYTEFSHLLDGSFLSTISSYHVIITYCLESSAYLPRPSEIWFHSAYPTSFSISTQHSPSGSSIWLYSLLLASRIYHFWSAWFDPILMEDLT